MRTLLTSAGALGDPRPVWGGNDGFAVNLVEHLGVPAFALDAERRVLLWNKACERLTGVPARQVVGTSNQWRAFHREPRPCLADLVMARRLTEIGALRASGDPIAVSEFGASAETWCAMPELGRPLYLAIDASPIYDSAGAMIAAVQTLRDITAQKLRQIELESHCRSRRTHRTGQPAKFRRPAEGGGAPSRSGRTAVVAADDRYRLLQAL